MTDSELFDVLCNLLEPQFDALLLCADVPTEYVSLGRGLQSQKGQQRPGAAPRVVRGGSWDVGAWGLRCARRFWHGPGNRRPGIGFRVVCRRFRQHVGD